MRDAGFRRVLLQIGLGYSRSLRRLALALLLVAATVSLSAAVVFPLWFFSTHDRTAYTIAVLALAVAALLYYLIRRTRAFWGLTSGERAARVRRLMGRVAAVIAYIVGLYLILGLYIVGLLVAAVPLSLAYLLILGYTLYARRSKPRR